LKEIEVVNRNSMITPLDVNSRNKKTAPIRPKQGIARIFLLFCNKKAACI
jgi:hypothetical protein